MISSRTMIYCFLLAIALSYSGWYYVRLQHIEDESSTKKLQRDFFANDVIYTFYSEEGTLSRRYTSEKLEHFPKKNLTVFTKPYVTVYEKNKAPWIIQASHGLALNNDEQITLSDNVMISQPAISATPPIVITTSEIHYVPKQQLAHTKKAVRFQQGDSVLNAKGLRAHLSEQHIELLSNARGYYAKTPHHQ